MLLKEFENLNGILVLNSIPLPALKAVALTQPGAVRPDLDNDLSGILQPGLRHETSSLTNSAYS